MKQQFLYILIALFTMSINASQKQYSEPDFAFPKQVIWGRKLRLVEVQHHLCCGAAVAF